ncbi:GDSL-type esterase/lipase family protein [Streptomyces sp. NPDC048275]|uniref:GDSL-type esterase/lipase family protein n=1 Tax=Streptomyces sp. NPDC048275 TaxID=3155629 RepID=UPI0033F6018E
MTTRIACLGDSLTRAQFSVDYLDLLGRRHPPGDVQLARFGANGDFAYNLLQRLDAVVTNPPDVITVLIGTNDARASLAGYPVEQAMKRKQLPDHPSAGWFQQCLGAVVARLRAETDATIGLLSTIGIERRPAPPDRTKALAENQIAALWRRRRRGPEPSLRWSRGPARWRRTRRPRSHDHVNPDGLGRRKPGSRPSHDRVKPPSYTLPGKQLTTPVGAPDDIEDLDGWTLHRLRHSALTHDAEDGTSTPMLLARSRHASVRSLERYARPGVDSVARHVAERDPAARRRT